MEKFVFVRSFVLRYSTSEHAAYPAPLIDASRTLSVIRHKVADWGVVANRIAVCGMSAGGHLAASLGTMWPDKEIAAASGIRINVSSVLWIGAFTSNYKNKLIMKTYKVFLFEKSMDLERIRSRSIAFNWLWQAGKENRA
ncbi:alpha/beta hydrolase [Paenibacillus sp. GXUN7292]|uniref:alpha/beta hydrolase n=1 Tax=Paenibacillus sp. GXUN7292 TaxID=3422499 RepID=UPI003D7D7947